jgi:hypothetical protein
LSSTTTMRLLGERFLNNFLRKSLKVSALNASHIYLTNLPVFKLMAPKQATDLRVGACCKIGSLISGGTHIRRHEPCCWKWHLSRLHSSMSSRLAIRRSCFTAATFTGVNVTAVQSFNHCLFERSLLAWRSLSVPLTFKRTLTRKKIDQKDRQAINAPALQ